MSRRIRTALTIVLATLTPAVATAQAQPPPPPPEWTGSLGAGLALTQGNSDTSTVNASYDIKREIETSPLVFQSKGLLLRGTIEDELSTSRLSLMARVDHRFNDRTSLFGQAGYLRDRFKEIDYLVSPTVGLAHRIVATDLTELSVNAGVGTVWEKNPEADVRFDGALTAGQSFSHKLSETATFTESVTALWKMRELADSLYVVNFGVAASMTDHTQLKVEIVNTFKNRPPDPSIEKNDVSLVMSIVFKY